MIAIMGATDQGKSTLMKYLIREYMRANPGCLVIGADPGGGFRESGLPGEFPRLGMQRSVMKAWAAEITNHGKPPPGPRVGLKGALVYLDDADRYMASVFPGNSEEYDPFRDMALAYRHQRLDMIFNFHRPQDVDKSLLNSATDIVSFAMEEPNSKKYMREFIGRPAADAIPNRPGLCLWWKKSPRGTKLVDVFKLCPLPGKAKAKNG